MTTDYQTTIRKYEERFIRKLGEVAILLHLSKTPEGSHAYELRSQASEILFERRKIGSEFLQDVLEILEEIAKIHSEKEKASEETTKSEEILKRLDNYPIIRFNIRIQKLVLEHDLVTSEDIDYLNEIIDSLRILDKEMHDSTEIWTNITSIYPAIESLEKNELIVLDREVPEAGRLKKIYKITKLGRDSVERVMFLLMDILSYVLETEGRHILFGERSIFSSKIVPFRNLLEKLIDGLNPDFRREMFSFKGKTQDSSFINMMTAQMAAVPMLNMLVRFPKRMKEQLESMETEEEKKMIRSFMKRKLTEQRDMINQMLKEL
ncbi:MAG: PadR family transcriptional regulator [Asgard group archaeon]|nr:PadR family transcriptional regulator [Asgard group archaeon]